MWYNVLVKGREVQTFKRVSFPRGDWSKRVNDLSCAGSKKNVKNPLTNPLKYDTIKASRGTADTSPTAWANEPNAARGRHQPKKVSRKLKFPLDKSPKLWYNKGVKGREHLGSWETYVGVELLAEAVYDPTFRHATFLKIISRNPLTNQSKYDTIWM